MNLYKLFVIFFVFNVQLLAKDPNVQLMEAIKDGKKAAVQKALDLGADINQVDINTHDNPSFYALTCALEAIIYAHDEYAYRNYANANLKLYEFTCAVAWLPTMIGLSALMKKAGLWHKSAADFPYFGILASAMSLFTCAGLASLPRVFFARSVLERIEIVTYLLKHDSLNIQYKHPIHQKTIAEFLDFLLIPQHEGYIGKYLYINDSQFSSTPMDSNPAVSFKLGKEHTIYLKTHAQRLVPSLKIIKDSLNREQQKTSVREQTNKLIAYASLLQ